MPNAMGMSDTGATPAAAQAPPPEVEQSTMPSEIAQQPTQNLATPPAKSTWGDRVYHGVLSALGGKYDVQYVQTPTGPARVTSQSTPGSQWKRIIAGAITGYMGAAATGARGPGSTSLKMGAGFEANQARQQQQENKQRGEAEQDFEVQQKAATQNAQNALLTHQIAQSTFNLGRSQVDAASADLERENTFSQVIAAGGQGSTDMGVFPDFASVMTAFKELPQLHDHQANGRLIAVPHIGADGKIDGVHAALVTPDWLNSKIAQDLPLTVRTYEDGKLKENTFTIPAGSITGDQYAKLTMQQSKDALDEAMAMRKQEDLETRQKAQNAQSYGAAAKDAADVKALSDATDDATIQNNARQIFEGSMDPSNLSKMARGKNGAVYNKTLAAVNNISMAETGQPFDVSKAMGDYKFATNQNTYNTLNYLNSLTGRDNKSGNLGAVVAMSDKLGQTKFPPINNVEQWAKLAAGNPQVAAYRGALVEVSDQIAKILQGGGTGNGTSDAKLKQAQDLLDKAFNPAQIREVADTLRTLLANRKKEIIGDNRYLMRWHGEPGAIAAPKTPATQTQPGAGKIISLADARALPQYRGKSDAEITADAKALGYTVQ